MECKIDQKSGTFRQFGRPCLVWLLPLGLRYHPSLGGQLTTSSTYRHDTSRSRRGRRRRYNRLALRSVEEIQEPLPSSWS